eukprot:4938672-Prymnesium_polylepis.1
MIGAVEESMVPVSRSIAWRARDCTALSTVCGEPATEHNEPMDAGRARVEQRKARAALTSKLIDQEVMSYAEQ